MLQLKMSRDIYMLIFFAMLQLPAIQSNHLSDNDCIDNYRELKQSLLDDRNTLLTAFYPPNESPTRVLNVFYYTEPLNATDAVEKPFATRNADYTFQWVDSSTLLLTEFDLFQVLSFRIAALKPNDVNVTIGPFCDEDKAIALLNEATVWLKSYSVGIGETERYYAQYFDGKKFIVMGNDIRDTTTLLLVFEYMGAIGFTFVIYTLLIISAFNAHAENLKYIGYFLSEISIPCFGFTIAIVTYNIQYYKNTFEYSRSEWLRALPIPVIFPVFSITNLIIAIIIIAVLPKIQKYNEAKCETKKKSEEIKVEEGRIEIKKQGAKEDVGMDIKEQGRESFPLPSIIQSMFFSHDHCPKVMNVIKRCIQVILLFSITSFTVLAAFHFIWVVLGFSAYPVRSVASLAFVLPIIFVSLAVFLIIEIISMFLEDEMHRDDKAKKVIWLINNMLGKDKNKEGDKKCDELCEKNKVQMCKKRRARAIIRRKLAFVAVLLLIVLPLLGSIFGVLYFYSRAIIDVNDSENNPLKTIIAAAIPSFVIGFFTYMGGKVVHSLISEVPPPQNVKIVDIDLPKQTAVTKFKIEIEEKDDEEQQQSSENETEPLITSAL